MKSHPEILKKHSKKFEGVSSSNYYLKDFIEKLKSEINKRGYKIEEVWNTIEADGAIKMRLSYDNEYITFLTDIPLHRKLSGHYNWLEKKQFVESIFNLKDYKDYKITLVRVSTNLNTGKSKNLLISKESVEFYLDGLWELRQYKSSKRSKTQKIKKITGIGLNAQLTNIAKEVNPALELANVDNSSCGDLYITCGKTQISIKKLRIKNREYINCKDKMRALFQYVSDVEALRQKTEFPIQYEHN